MSNFLQSLIRVSELVILNSVVVVCLYAPPSSEAQTKQFDFPGRKEATSQSFPAKCEFDNLIIPANAKIYAAGAYSGRKLDFQIDSS